MAKPRREPLWFSVDSSVCQPGSARCAAAAGGPLKFAIERKSPCGSKNQARAGCPPRILICQARQGKLVFFCGYFRLPTAVHGQASQLQISTMLHVNLDGPQKQGTSVLFPAETEWPTLRGCPAGHGMIVLFSLHRQEAG